MAQAGRRGYLGDMHPRAQLNSTQIIRFAAARCWALLHPEPVSAADDTCDKDWTVVTIARGGAWGVATEPYLGQAIAAAIHRCKEMDGTNGGCGAQHAASRGAWIVAKLCGGEPIIAAASSLAAAEQAAMHREIDLQVAYVPDLPPCRRLLTAGPDGSVSIQDDNWALAR